MKRFLLVVLVVLAGWGGSAGAQPKDTLPIERIKPGMTGYGLTVFSGFKIERFKVRVIDVLRNFLPKQDLFLVYVDHPIVRKTGVVGGMSGSPIYIQGKLAGALAYGWRFAKEPVAGITPIKNMADLLKRKLRGPQAAGYARVERQPSELLARGDRWRKLPLTAAATPSATSLAPVSLPLSAAGFTEEAMGLLKKTFAGYGFEPVQGGGTGRAEGPKKFEPGSAVGVELVSGDMSLAATGTVTWVGPGKVLAFGHRLFNAGEIYLPTVTARINHTVASLARSFKLSSPARRVGALVQDRQAGILVETARRVDTVPMTVTMRFQGQKRVFRTRIAHHRLLTPTLATSVLSSALSEALADVTHATVKMTARFTVKGYPRVKLVDHFHASAGAGPTAVMFSRGLRELRQVMDNDFEPALIDRIDIDMQVSFANDVVEITGVRVASSNVAPGDRLNLVVTFRPFAGHEFTKAYPLEIPRDMGGSVLVAEVASGNTVKPDVAPPQTLRQLLRNIQEDYPARAVVVSLQVPTQGVKIRGQVIRDLPTSIIDTLNTGTQTRSEQLFQTVLREVHGTRRLVSGKKSIRIRVKNEVNQ
jgi:hypothetical protein